ncbi:putative Ribosomal large subunit assembly and maintenance-related protein [Rhodotorula toruloides ATCC 204091]|uniref:BY PROTMAP: gi/342321662/gb/EGU13594.1/ putative Ribosomal large subunit assembly and maintenance-related protein [Rhodotorula glutinis ATCC 204091] n=1 Tax=Rhodotorula toruloides TaxID=5286 RepID=A0A0K3CGQ4_RHOTO|nr:putative Ribosomal large subunit assembly and maintenance-related protein [Rhodotorula toruloides ATCC 204091]KAK4335014.1 Ribosome biogenesis protein BRX1 [Rhodotorula toruloides]
MAPSTLTKQSLKRKRADDDSTSSTRTDADKPQQPYKQRVLVTSSRGISQRQRHLMTDLLALLPHAKKETKLEDKHNLPAINELCYLSSCNNALFFEARRQHNDLYLWAAKAPNGPSVRFHVLNLHTMDEMKMTGNCLKGSRPVVVFDKQFDEEPHWKLIKEVLTHIFAVPKTARRAKPFIDHVINFSIADGKIWFRNYQILDTPSTDALSSTTSSTSALTDIQAKKLAKKQGAPHLSLSEVGPRFVLNPVKIFEGSFNGACLYENKEFVPSSARFASTKLARAAKYRGRKDQQAVSKSRREGLHVGERDDPLEKRRVFA